MFICESGSFSNQDDSDHEAYVSPCSTPKRSRRSTSFCNIMERESGSKNLYAGRGLDKFYALLAYLDDKKQEIYTAASRAPPTEAKSEKTMKKKIATTPEMQEESFKLEDLKHPHFYFQVMVVLILLFLTIYGRFFAILCTSIGWYLAPTITGGSGATTVASERKPKRKKEYVRKKSEVVHSEDPSSPKSVINGLNRVHQQHDCKTSW
ncbi:uncharacterized protein LOC131009621 [Salvia miltiorrhiza]|uniref:uncharacterized protein LOC131009621 n=1 Tax=Salvia miltiorrhiza TaxID=226208 RepID=UPI0025ACD806|nr:uncharacterized protein LOC131009621 [Salvia miltiorrhiza]